MRVAYVVSMFPSLSETFILNELVSHEQAGLDLSIYSFKNFNEAVMHDKAMNFIGRTVYPGIEFWISIWFLHLYFAITQPITYISTCFKLAIFKTNYRIKLKSLAILFCAPYFIYAAKRQKIDHLHAHFATYPALLAWIVNRFSNIPFSVTAHAHDIYQNQDILKVYANHAKAIVAISKYNRKLILDTLGWESCAKEKLVQVLHCGIDVSSFSSYKTQRQHYDGNRVFRILSVGRLAGKKGFKYLLESLALLKLNNYRFTCEIIGDGPLREELRIQSETLGLNEYVSFLGAKKTEEVITCMQQADAFVIACAIDKLDGQDGIPVAFMEAMAMGVPVIGTEVSGIPELIIHGKTGLCAIPEDPNSLKINIEYLMNQYAKGLEMTRYARLTIEQEFNTEINSRLLRSIFQSA